jgi:hypothetical protein
VAPDAIEDVESRYRQNDRDRLSRQISEGSLLAARGMTFGSGNRPVAPTKDEPVGDNA